MSDDLITSLRALAAARHDDLSIAVDAVIEIERLRAENERLRENVDRAGKEAERADRLRAEIARVKADEKKNRAEIKRQRAEIERLRKVYVLIATESAGIVEGGSIFEDKIAGCYASHQSADKAGENLGYVNWRIEEHTIISKELEGKP